MTKHRALCAGRLLFLLVASWLVVCAPAWTKPQGKPAPEPKRLVAIGDVHGDYEGFAAMLQRAGLLDAKLRWAGKDTTFVLTGDFLDRGPKDREVMDLLMRLEKEAPKKRGRALVLLGNHETMNLMGDLRYVSKEVYASFAEADSEKRRAKAFEDYVKLLREIQESRGQAAVEMTPEAQKAWMEAHPLGFLEHRDAMAPAGKYGRWLREHAAVTKVGGTVFVHGGISPALAGKSIDEINKRVGDEIAALDFLRQYLTEKRLALPFYTIDELVRAAQGEIEFRNAEMGQKAAEATAEGKTFTPPAEMRQHLDRLSSLTNLSTWYSLNAEGPLWFRGYAIWPEEEGAPRVESILASLGAERIVVGHTPQRGKINVRFGGRVFLIDTGMLTSYYTGGRGSALEMAAGHFTAIYPDERVTLEPAARPAGVPGASPEPEEIELPGGGVQQTAAASIASAAPAPKKAVLWYTPDGKPLPFQTYEDVQAFLRTAKVVKVRGTARGIAGTQRMTLEKDGIQMNGAFRTVKEQKPIARLANGKVELNFRDHYIFEQAAYELALALGLDNVPPTVVRSVYGEQGTLQAWVEGGMVEQERQKNKIAPPDSVYWNRQVQVMRVFDNLIDNSDRNMGNIVIDRDWKIWMIDHTRAFRRNEELRSANGIVQCEGALFEKLKTLDEAALRTRLKEYLQGAEIDAIFVRRKLLIQHIERMIAERGEENVLFTLEP